MATDPMPCIEIRHQFSPIQNLVAIPKIPRKKPWITTVAKFQLIIMKPYLSNINDD